MTENKTEYVNSDEVYRALVDIPGIKTYRNLSLDPDIYSAVYRYRDKLNPVNGKELAVKRRLLAGRNVPKDKIQFVSYVGNGLISRIGVIPIEVQYPYRYWFYEPIPFHDGKGVDVPARLTYLEKITEILGEDSGSPLTIWIL